MCNKNIRPQVDSNHRKVATFRLTAERASQLRHGGFMSTYHLSSNASLFNKDHLGRVLSYNCIGKNGSTELYDQRTNS